MHTQNYWILIFLLLSLNPLWANSTDRAVKQRIKEQPLAAFPYQNSWALLIGINRYPNLPLHPLHYAVNDVNELKQLLVKKYQFPESNITTLTDEQATKQGIIDALGELTDKDNVTPDDRILVYFSGHGQTVPLPNGGEMGFLLPYDAKVDLNDVTNFSDYFTSCIRMEELKNLGPGIPAKHVLFLVDACYSGLAVSARGGLKPSIPDYLQKVASLPVRQIIVAGLKGELAFEKPEWGHGAFTYKLLEALKTGVADGNSDGVITALELASHLRNVVPTIAKQTPHSGYFEGEGEFLFIRDGLSFPLRPVPPVSGQTDRLPSGTPQTPLIERQNSGFTHTESYERHRGLKAGLLSAVLPGGGQMSKGQWGRGMGFLGAEILLISGALWANSERQDFERSAENARFREDEQSLRTKADRLSIVSFLAWGVAGGVYVYNLVDAVKGSPPKRDVSSASGMQLQIRSHAVVVGYSRSF